MLSDRTRTELYCDCPDFKALDDIDREADERRKAAAAERFRRKFVDAIGIPKHYANAVPDVALATDVVRNGGLFMVGGAGRGKTHAACAMLLALYDVPGRPQSARFVSAPNLMRSVRSAYDVRGLSEEDVMREYETCGILVLDDLGKGKKTEWLMEKTYQIVDNRYANDMPMVVTSQYGWEKLGIELAKSGDEDTTEAILSRLSEMCRTMVFDGPDLRTRRS